MRILIEAGAALRVAARLTEEGAVARRLRTAFWRVGADVQDPGLRAGLAHLADLMGDVLELVEADLVLMTSKVRGASRAYDQVEGVGSYGLGDGAGVDGPGDGANSTLGGVR